MTKQSFNIPPPTLTEKNLKSQAGRVIIITGGYAGIGLELSKILYNAGATVYIAGRSEEKANTALKSIKSTYPASKGKVNFLQLDLSSLSSIKQSAEAFLAQEDRLDVLINNAGVMTPPSKTTNKDGHDLQWGTNCLGPFLFTQFLIPILSQTATTAPANSVRILWAGSAAIQTSSPKGGIVYEKGKDQIKLFSDQMTNYGGTKVGNLYLAHVFQQQLKSKGIVSTCFNPGNLRSELQRHMPTPVVKILNAVLLHPTVFGAYTELWAAVSEDLTVEKSVKYVMPWGRDGDDLLREDVKKGLDDGAAQKFWDHCEKETASYN
jgi:retinol dehydrogenase 12